MRLTPRFTGRIPDADFHRIETLNFKGECDESLIPILQAAVDFHAEAKRAREAERRLEMLCVGLAVLLVAVCAVLR